jgi:hypothetical protein
MVSAIKRVEFVSARMSYIVLRGRWCSIIFVNAHALTGDHFGDPGVDGRIISRLIFKKWNGGSGMDWIEVAQDRDRWRTLLNAVMNLRVP